jgi:hypothetical protein
MSFFDQLAGLAEGFTRRPLKTLDEAGGGTKSTPAATTDYGKTPRNFVHGSPNTAYRPQPKQDYGKCDEPSPRAAALRTKKPYQHGAG